MLRVGLGRITPVNARSLTPPTFLLNFADLGSGQVSTVEGAGNAAPTFTRATAAWTKLSTGLWASVNSGVPRSFYGGLDTTVGTYAGYLSEGARTNECLQARTGTATVWIKTSTTATQNQTGIDGSANSCFSLAGTGANGTALQAVASTFTAAISRTFSCFVKRLVGSGAVAITADGATFSTVTPSINSSTFTQVQVTASVATATVGIKLVTSGDSVAVDMCQEEQATFASTPIPTTAAAVARNSDVLTYPFTTNTGTLFVQGLFNSGSVALSQALASINNNATTDYIAIEKFNANVAANIVQGGVTQAAMASTATVLGVSLKAAMSYATNNGAASVNGGAVGTDTSITLPAVQLMGVGNTAGANQSFGATTFVRVFAPLQPGSVLQQITT